MRLDDLTIGQAKELAAMFGSTQKEQSFTSPLIGKYVIVRCRDAGVHAGVLVSSDGRSCVLSHARRLWYWVVQGSGDFLNAIALSGVHPDSKLSAPVDLIQLTENCEIILCSDDAAKSIQEQAVYNG